MDEINALRLAEQDFEKKCSEVYIEEIEMSDSILDEFDTPEMGEGTVDKSGRAFKVSLVELEAAKDEFLARGGKVEKLGGYDG